MNKPYATNARRDNLTKIDFTDAQFRRLRTAIDAGVPKVKIGKRFGHNYATLERYLAIWEQEQKESK